MSNPHYASGLIKKLSTAAVRTVFVYCLCPVNLGHLEQDNNMCFTEIFFYFFCEETILFFGFLIWDIICNRHCNQSWKSRDELLSAYYLYTFSGHKKSINKQDNWTEKKSMTNRDNWTEQDGTQTAPATEWKKSSPGTTNIFAQLEERPKASKNNRGNNNTSVNSVPSSLEYELMAVERKQVTHLA